MSRIEFFKHSQVRLTLMGGMLMAIAPWCSAQDWARNWEIEQHSSVGLGYDSDIFGNDLLDTEDGFARADHSVSIARKNSLTDLAIDAHAAGARYFSERNADFLDGGVTIEMGYPNSASDVSYWKGSAYWERTTDIDLSLARRMQPTMYGGRLDGEWFASPKLGLSGSLQHLVNDRSADGATRSRKLRIRTGVSHEWRPEQRWNYEYSFTRGKTDAGNRSDVHELGVRVRGRLTPKITGDAFVGVQRAEYTGSQNFADTGPSASADLTWRSSPRLTAKLEVDREYDFAANGSATLRTLMTLRMERELGQGYQLSGFLTRGLMSYDFDGEDRGDRYWMIGSTLRYAFTQRFFAEVSFAHLANESSVSSFDADRLVAFFQTGMRY